MIKASDGDATKACVERTLGAIESLLQIIGFRCSLKQLTSRLKAKNVRQIFKTFILNQAMINSTRYTNTNYLRNEKVSKTW